MSGRKILGSVVAVLLSFAAIFLYCCFTTVDFNDYPGYLSQISPDGKIHLETYDGEIARNVTAKAQVDAVYFVRKRDRTLRIWYQGETGPVDLNRELADSQN